MKTYQDVLDDSLKDLADDTGVDAPSIFRDMVKRGDIALPEVDLHEHIPEEKYDRLKVNFTRTFRAVLALNRLQAALLVIRTEPFDYSRN